MEILQKWPWENEVRIMSSFYISDLKFICDQRTLGKFWLLYSQLAAFWSLNGCWGANLCCEYIEKQIEHVGVMKNRKGM